jgi:hypothetical protein
MAAIATLEDGRLWLRLYDQGECFAITLSPLAALVLARDLLDAAIALQQREPLDPALEERIAEGEHDHEVVLRRSTATAEGIPDPAADRAR